MSCPLVSFTLRQPFPMGFKWSHNPRVISYQPQNSREDSYFDNSSGKSARADCPWTDWDPCHLGINHSSQKKVACVHWPRLILWLLLVMGVGLAPPGLSGQRVSEKETTHSMNLLSTYCMPGSALGAGNTPGTPLALMELILQVKAWIMIGEGVV